MDHRDANQKSTKNVEDGFFEFDFWEMSAQLIVHRK